MGQISSPHITRHRDVPAEISDDDIRHIYTVTHPKAGELLLRLWEYSFKSGYQPAMRDITREHYGNHHKILNGLLADLSDAKLIDWTRQGRRVFVFLRPSCTVSKKPRVHTPDTYIPSDVELPANTFVMPEEVLANDVSRVGAGCEPADETAVDRKEYTRVSSIVPLRALYSDTLVYSLPEPILHRTKSQKWKCSMRRPRRVTTPQRVLVAPEVVTQHLTQGGVAVLDHSQSGYTHEQVVEMVDTVLHDYIPGRNEPAKTQRSRAAAARAALPKQPSGLVKEPRNTAAKKRKPVDPNVDVFFSYWNSHYKMRFGSEYAVIYAQDADPGRPRGSQALRNRDRAIIKRLLAKTATGEGHDLWEMLAAADIFLQFVKSDGDYLLSKYGHTIPMFIKHLPSIVEQNGVGIAKQARAYEKGLVPK